MPTIFESKKSKSDEFVQHKSMLKKSESRFLNSFCVNPNVRFDSQNEDEQVYLLLRSHPITQIPWIIVTMVLFFIPLFLNVFLGNLVEIQQLIFINLLWYTLLFTYAFINVLNYVFNVGLVTNYRIIDIDYNSILYKEINETVLSKVEDVTSKTGGVVRSFFHFGNLFVQTAGAQANIEFADIPEPNEAAAIINELMKINAN